MADNVKDQPENDLADFDFNGPDWDQDEDVANIVAPVTASDDEDPFGQGAFGDDDPFGSQSPTASAAGAGLPEIDDDVFGQTGPDPFLTDTDGDDSFEIHNMPIPGSASGSGDDFDDLTETMGQTSYAKSDGFDSADDLFAGATDASSVEATRPHDPFAQDSDYDDQDMPQTPAPRTAAQSDDPFNEDETEQAEEAPAAVSKRSKLVMPLALAAVVALVGYVGYSMNLPAFFSSGNPPVETANVAPNTPSFPAALPGQDGGLPLPQNETKRNDEGRHSSRPDGYRRHSAYGRDEAVRYGHAACA